MTNPPDCEENSGQEGSEDSNGKKERPSETAIGSNFEERELGQISDLEIVRRLWKYIRPYKGIFFACLALLPIITAARLLQPHLIQVAIDSHLVPGDYQGLIWVITGFAGAVIGKAAFEYLQFYLMQKAGQSSLVDLRQHIFDHVQKRPTDFFHDNPVGRLMTRMTTDVESLQDAVSSGMITMVGDFLMLFGIAAILIYKDWRLALVSFSILPLLVGLTAIFRHYLRQAYRDVRTKIARLYAHLQESITGMNIIQLFVRENVSADEYRDINTEYRNANLRSIRYDAMLYAVVEAVGSITIGAIIWYGSGQVLQDLTTLGVLVAFIEYMRKFFRPIRDLAEKYNQFQSAIASGERIFQLLDNDEKIPQKDDPKPLPETPLTIEFDDVWFAYNEDEWILKDVSFTVEPGERVALVGHTGAGKTTITNLLLRLYDIDRGSIRINGIDIREFDLRAYRRFFAVVLQDVFLFEGSVRENLTLGDDSISDEEIEQAARAVHAHQMVQKYDDGYDHHVTERGANLSAGEKQLIAFARALVLHPEILILDEATASVDTDTEALIQDAVEVLLDQQTSLVIAHRLSTIESSDRILVLHRGEIVERGTHSELLKNNGHYSKLHRLQYAETDTTSGSPSSDPAAAVGE